MSISLGANQYGKAENRVVRIYRDTPRHEIRDLNVSTSLRGDFADAHVTGDQADVLPTDTQKNTAFAFAKQHGVSSPEDYALALGRRFLEGGARPTARQDPGRAVRLGPDPVGADGHDHAFFRRGDEARTAVVTVDDRGDAEHVSVVSGLQDLVVLKSTGSEFKGFLKDEYTTLQETDDRILATSLVARWRYANTDVDWNATLRLDPRDAARGVRHDLQPRAAGDAVPDGHARARDPPDDVAEIRFSAPNKHHFLVDLEPFGLEQRRRGVHRRRPALRPDRGDGGARRRPRPGRRLARRPGVRPWSRGAVPWAITDWTIWPTARCCSPSSRCSSARRLPGRRLRRDRVLVAVARAARSRPMPRSTRSSRADARRRRAARRAELLRGRPRRARRRGALRSRTAAAQFRDNLDVAVGIGEQLGVTAFNALYGNRVDGRRSRASRTSSAARTSAAPPTRPPGSAPPSSSSRSAAPSRTRCARPPMPWRWSMRCASAGTRTSGSSATCSTWPTTVTTSTPRSRVRRRHRPRADRRPSRSGRARQRRARPRPPPRRPRRPRVRRAGWAWSTSPPPTPRPSLPGYPGRGARSSRTSPTEQGATHDHDRLHRPGHHGQPMAVHLQEAGPTSRATTCAATRRPLVDAGGRAATSIAEPSRAPTSSRSWCPTPPTSQEVLDRRGRRVRERAPGPLIIDFSSIRPDVTAELAKQAASKGFRLLDAPVSGGEAGAKNAALSIMVGGEAADFAAAKPIFDAVGKTIVHVGPNGAGQTVKAANQLIVGANIQVLAEALVFLEAYGVDTEAAMEVLGGGLAGSKVLEQKKRGNMLGRTFDPGLPDRPAPQGHGHRHLRGARGRRRASARRDRRAADGLGARLRRRRPRPLGAAARRRATLRHASRPRHDVPD